MFKIHNFSILALLLFCPFQARGDCGAKGVQCTNSTTYQTCRWFLWWTIYDSEYYTCEDGTACDQDDGSSVCVATTTSIAPTTAPAVTRPTSCGSFGVHCFNDTAYRPCSDFFGVYLYFGEYMWCPEGTTCDEDGAGGACAVVTTAAAPGSTTAAQVEGSAWWCWLFLNLFC